LEGSHRRKSEGIGGEVWLRRSMNDLRAIILHR
jgi:hypothetical protein